MRDHEILSVQSGVELVRDQADLMAQALISALSVNSGLKISVIWISTAT
jgi:hypothetical protein